MKRHPVQFKQTMWELINAAALRDGKKKGIVITPADYVRKVISRNVNRRK
jgi:hypothetical protein